MDSPSKIFNDQINSVNITSNSKSISDSNGNSINDNNSKILNDQLSSRINTTWRQWSQNPVCWMIDYL